MILIGSCRIEWILNLSRKCLRTLIGLLMGHYVLTYKYTGITVYTLFVDRNTASQNDKVKQDLFFSP